jgi:hypothetical protein
MTDRETLLQDLFARDEPPARDPAFVTAAMARVARRRFQLALLALVAPTVAAGFAAWALAPSLAGLAAGFDLTVIGPAAAAIALAVMVTWTPARA